MRRTFVDSLLSLVGRCTHDRYSFPQTVKAGKDKGKTTVACLDCGKTLPYDWAGLGAEEEIKPPKMTAPRVIVIETSGQYDLGGIQK
jgi:hypothetical protein